MQSKPPFEVLIPTSLIFLLGVLSELFMKPLQPITYVPGLALVPLGVGVGSALLARKWKLAGSALYGVGFVGTLYYMIGAETSPLPITLLIFGYGITRFLLFFQSE
jgi:hypothetical protein